ncbi:MAG: SDR family oxidoreductase [Pseudomonadota bacterium]
MSVDGKTVIVTGASRGIGEATAEVFAHAGAKVGLLARSEGAITEIAARIGESAMPATCDVSDYASLETAIRAVEKAFGPTDILINNAGAVEPISHLASADPVEWAKIIDINLKGVFYGMRAVMPAMIERGAGTIITISSGAAHGPVEAWSHYCASKAGAAMLTRCADKEAGDSGLRVMGLSPGTVATQMQKEIKASGINPVSQLDWSAHIPAEWPAKALLWMCSADADEYIGTEISLRDENIRRRIGLLA